MAFTPKEKEISQIIEATHQPENRSIVVSLWFNASNSLSQSFSRSRCIWYQFWCRLRCCLGDATVGWDCLYFYLYCFRLSCHSYRSFRWSNRRNSTHLVPFHFSAQQCFITDSGYHGGICFLFSCFSVEFLCIRRRCEKLYGMGNGQFWRCINESYPSVFYSLFNRYYSIISIGEATEHPTLRTTICREFRD